MVNKKSTIDKMADKAKELKEKAGKKMCKAKKMSKCGACKAFSCKSH